MLIFYKLNTIKNDLIIMRMYCLIMFSEFFN